MKANAPERLYLSKTIYSTYLYQVPDSDDKSAVEYTRTDAFIKKACSWLEENVEKHISADGEYTVYYTEMFEEFKKYMKGE